MMNNKDLQAAYIERLNCILPTVEFAKLDHSCNSAEDDYAKEVLKQMHDAFVEVYGTDYLDNSDYEFVELPVVNIGLGIVSLDLDSSGEHWGTFFLTPMGVIDQGNEKLQPTQSNYLSTIYIPYDYWYTVSVERDHHVDFENLPEKIADMLNACYPDQPELKME